MTRDLDPNSTLYVKKKGMLLRYDRYQKRTTEIANIKMMALNVLLNTGAREREKKK